MEYREDGVLESWSVGVLEYCSAVTLGVGLPEYRIILSFIPINCSIFFYVQVVYPFSLFSFLFKTFSKF